MNPPPAPLFARPVGAYRRLDSFTLATIIQTETWRFCREFLDRRNDPKGRWFDQMTQAARSGRADIAEGSVIFSDFALTGGLREQMSATRRTARAAYPPPPR